MNHLLGHLEVHLFVYFPKEITLTELKNKIFLYWLLLDVLFLSEISSEILFICQHVCNMCPTN